LFFLTILSTFFSLSIATILWSFLCSITWGDRWLFILLISVVYLICELFLSLRQIYKLKFYILTILLQSNTVTGWSYLSNRVSLSLIVFFCQYYLGHTRWRTFSIFLPSDLRWQVIIHFVDIGWIVDHQCLNFSFNNIITMMKSTLGRKIEKVLHLVWPR
jgi:hypothetical protein